MSKNVVKYFNAKQRKALSVGVIVVLLLAIYFLRDYFFVIGLSTIVAFLFNPIYKKLLKKTKNRVGFSITLTFFISVITISIPVGLILAFTIDQAIQFARDLANSAAQGTTLGQFVDQIINYINNSIDKLPGHAIQHVSTDEVFIWIQSNADNFVKYALNFVTSLAGSVITFIAKAVIYVYIFISVLRNQDKILYTIRRINPLGERATNLYLGRIGAMTTAMVKGQFIIAAIQGLISTFLLWIVGIDYLFLWFVLLTFVSIIPLGSGVLIYPIGAILILTGNFWQGILLIVGHILIVTNIDNVLRPKFAPKKARLDSALVILSIFAGIALFGFIGIVMGPILMILIVTTIQVYLAAVDHESAALQKETDKLNEEL